MVAAIAGLPTAQATQQQQQTLGHVFVIVLENQNFDTTWGPGSPAPYLSSTLREQGVLLEQYYGLAHYSLPNYLAMISGQPPNERTQADCATFSEFDGVVGPDGIAVGQGCVYPPEVPTLVDQLEAAGFTWAAYMQDMGDDVDRDGGSTCAHPELGASDETQEAAEADQYATRHNPFVYFHSVIDDATCSTNVVNLDRLTPDLASAATTANYSFIAPDLCNDAHDTPCVTGEPGGLVQADAFLRELVPQILESPAFRADGMLLITFDEAEATGTSADASSCCGQTAGPNTAQAGQTGPGGGRTGALVLSPFAGAGTTSQTPYNHYSMLRSIEDIFGLDHLGFAAGAGLEPFGDDVLTSRSDLPASPPSSAARVANSSGTSTPILGVLIVAAGAALVVYGLSPLIRRRRVR